MEDKCLLYLKKKTEEPCIAVDNIESNTVKEK